MSFDNYYLERRIAELEKRVAKLEKRIKGIGGQSMMPYPPK